MQELLTSTQEETGTEHALTVYVLSRDQAMSLYDKASVLRERGRDLHVCASRIAEVHELGRVIRAIYKKMDRNIAIANEAKAMDFTDSRSVLSHNKSETAERLQAPAEGRVSAASAVTSAEQTEDRGGRRRPIQPRDLQLTPFDGASKLAWPVFWQLFKTNIGDVEIYTSEEKFAYLQQFLTGEAAKKASMFDSYDGDKYKAVVRDFQRRYGKGCKMEEEWAKTLEALPRLTKDESVK